MKATGATAYPCDASDPADVDALFAKTASDVGVPDAAPEDAFESAGLNCAVSRAVLRSTTILPITQVRLRSP